MPAETTIEVLNQLVAIHNRSLAMYLGYAAPSWHRGDELARETLELMVADQKATVDRLGEMIVESGGAVRYGAFPMGFTSYHDLSFEFLLKRLIEHQRRDIAAIERCVQQLTLAPMAKAVASEALGSAKAHLESLLELRKPKAAHAAT